MASNAACNYDVLIIGAGLVGCALARELARFELRVGVVEQNHDVGDGISKANSGIIHTGFDAKPGTLEARLVVEGSKLWHATAPELGVPIATVGAVLLALDEEQAASTAELVANARRNGLTDVQVISRDEVLRRVPEANRAVLAGLWVPGESISCTFTAAIALAEHAGINGVQFHLGHRVTGIAPADQVHEVRTDRGCLMARWIVNSAGLWADEISRLVGSEAFTITPRKGEFLILDKSARSRVPHILLPVPTRISKGILVAPTINGNVLMGPTAEDVEDKTDLGVSAKGLDQVRSGALNLLPGLAEEPVIATYAGLRSASSAGDYIISVDARSHVVTTAGIRSTGLTAALAIAREVRRRLEESGVTLRERAEGLKPRPPRPWAPGQPRPCRDAGHVRLNPAMGRILCQCEAVSEGEIVEALRAPLPVSTLDAIKKRTWATTGRCQGFYCTAAILEVMARELAVSPTRLTKRGPGSELVGPETNQR